MKAIWMSVAIAGLALGSTSCGIQNDQNASQAQTQPQRPSVSVDVAIADFDALQTASEYTGTTTPIREVAVRSRLEGRLLDLSVDVGDRVGAGQAIAQLDDTVLSATVLQAEAEVAAREAEVSQANASVGNALAQVERAKLEYKQSQIDANRFTQLAKEGAVSPQTAESAVTRAKTAEQSLRSAEQQVQLQRQNVGATSQRVLAQEAIRLREQERQSYTTIAAPIDGIVLEKVSEIGSLLFAGNEVVKLGDFSQVKVIVQISELEIAKIRLNQSVDIRFDSFPDQKFTGMVRRISPVADPVARLIPVEIVVNNRDGKIGSGQLARVQFASNQAQQIVIAETALEVGGRGNARNSARANSGNSGNSNSPSGSIARSDGNVSRNSSANPANSPSGSSSDRNQARTATVFVIAGDAKEPKVEARQVTLGERRDGKVAIRSGLKSGDRVVVRSGGRLQDGDTVKLSVLSKAAM